MQVPRVPSHPRSVPSKAMETLFSPAKHARVAALQPKRFVSARRAAVRKLKRFVWRLVSCSDLDAPSTMSPSACSVCAMTSGCTRRRLPALQRRSANSFGMSSYRDRGHAPHDHEGRDVLRNKREGSAAKRLGSGNPVSFFLQRKHQRRQVRGVGPAVSAERDPDGLRRERLSFASARRRR